MRDRDVRFALRHKVLAEHLRDTDTLVVEELGLAHGAARVDIAVVNGSMHGFEIKSDADTLRRLPAQVDAYGAVLDRVTIVVGPKYALSVEHIVPAWWGVKLATAGGRGAIHFCELRAPKQNQNIDAFALAGMLWREEAIASLARRGMTRVKSKTRVELCRLIAGAVPLDELRAEVRDALKVRVGWRSDGRSEPYAGLSLPFSNS